MGAAFSRLGWDAQAIFENPDQVLQFIGARAFLAEVFSQLLDLLLERGFIGGGRSSWVAGGLAGTGVAQRESLELEPLKLDLPEAVEVALWAPRTAARSVWWSHESGRRSRDEWSITKLTSLDCGR